MAVHAAPAPAQLARLRREPALLPGAVEEMLRFEPPILFVSRVAQADVEWAGVPCARATSSTSGSPRPTATPTLRHPDRFEVGRPPFAT
jgi:cytochrome P450